MALPLSPLATKLSLAISLALGLSLSAVSAQASNETQLANFTPLNPQFTYDQVFTANQYTKPWVLTYPGYYLSTLIPPKQQEALDFFSAPSYVNTGMYYRMSLIKTGNTQVDNFLQQLYAVQKGISSTTWQQLKRYHDVLDHSKQNSFWYGVVVNDLTKVEGKYRGFTTISYLDAPLRSDTMEKIGTPKWVTFNPLTQQVYRSADDVFKYADGIKSLIRNAYVQKILALNPEFQLFGKQQELLQSLDSNTSFNYDMKLSLVNTFDVDNFKFTPLGVEFTLYQAPSYFANRYPVEDILVQDEVLDTLPAHSIRKANITTVLVPYYQLADKFSDPALYQALTQSPAMQPHYQQRAVAYDAAPMMSKSASNFTITENAVVAPTMFKQAQLQVFPRVNIVGFDQRKQHFSYLQLDTTSNAWFSQLLTDNFMQNYLQQTGFNLQFDPDGQAILTSLKQQIAQSKQLPSFAGVSLGVGAFAHASAGNLVNSFSLPDAINTDGDTTRAIHDQLLAEPLAQVMTSYTGKNSIAMVAARYLDSLNHYASMLSYGSLGITNMPTQFQVATYDLATQDPKPLTLDQVIALPRMADFEVVVRQAYQSNIYGVQSGNYGQYFSSLSWDQFKQRIAELQKEATTQGGIFPTYNPLIGTTGLKFHNASNPIFTQLGIQNQVAADLTFLPDHLDQVMFSLGKQGLTLYYYTQQPVHQLLTKVAESSFSNGKATENQGSATGKGKELTTKFVDENNPYNELAAQQGKVTNVESILLPFEQIKDLLTPEFRTLLSNMKLVTYTKQSSPKY